MASPLGTMLLSLAMQYDKSIDKRISDAIADEKAKERKCMMCDELHTNNNCYCSAECCRADKEK